MPRSSSMLVSSDAGKRSIKKRDSFASKRNSSPAERVARAPPPTDSASNENSSDPLAREHSGADVISLLNLQPHPEGGFYRRTYCSDVAVSTPRGERMSCSAIIYALLPGQIGKLHRIESDELWHHYAGPSLEIIELDSAAAGHVRRTVLGKNVYAPHCNQLQHVVRARTWFGARVPDAAAVGAHAAASVVGCTVSPSFDFADFELGDRKQLLRLYPRAGDVIRSMT